MKITISIPIAKYIHQLIMSFLCCAMLQATPEIKSTNISLVSRFGTYGIIKLTLLKPELAHNIELISYYVHGEQRTLIGIATFLPFQSELITTYDWAGIHRDDHYEIEICYRNPETGISTHLTPSDVIDFATIKANAPCFISHRYKTDEYLNMHQAAISIEHMIDAAMIAGIIGSTIYTLYRLKNYYFWRREIKNKIELANQAWQEIYGKSSAETPPAKKVTFNPAIKKRTLTVEEKPTDTQFSLKSE